MNGATCPVCEAAVSAGDPSCGRCGFPTALREEAVRALPGPGHPSQDLSKAPDHAGPVGPRSPRTRPGTDPVEAFAAELAEGIASLRRKGKEVDGYLGELHRAALAEIDGRSPEAVTILRAAIERLSSESRANTEARMAELEARRRALALAGVDDGLEPSVERIRRSMAAGRYAEASELLGVADPIARRLEEQCRQFQTAIAAIEEMWKAAATAGLLPAGMEPGVVRIRRFLSEPRHSIEALGSASASASELLELLRNELASSFSSEIARNAEALSRYPVEDGGAQTARRLNAEAAAGTHDGRFADAAPIIAELRRVTEALPPPGEPAPSPRPRPEPPAAKRPAAPGAGVTKASLLVEVRELATRVRSLPPGSEAAAEAAREIRRATELLVEQRRLQEAHEILARLMGILDAAAAGGEGGRPA
jgi:hypothetical protein